MKVGFVHYSKFPEGGAERVTSNLAPYLKRRGYEIFVFASGVNESLLTESDKENISIIKVNKDDFTAPINSDNLLVSESKRLNIDILVYVGEQNFSIIIKEIAEKVGCKSIFAHHGVPFWEMVDLKENLSRELHVKNKNYFSSLKHRFIKIPQKISQKKEELISTFSEIYENSDAFTVLCEEYKNIFQKELNLDNTEKIYVLPNGILSAPISYCFKKKKQLLYLGRMSYADKRVDRLIEIWKDIYKKFPDWEFLLVGDGLERENLEKMAESLERIYFLGSTKVPYQYYNDAAILCMSSQFEGWGLVLTEAQQAGVVPIAFNCSAGVESILTPSWENGVLVDGFSVNAYKSSLCRLMKDEDLRNKIQQNILLKSQEYDMEIIAKNWDKLFQSII